MIATDIRRIVGIAVAGVALSGCVAAVPAQPALTVIPGQGKTEANLRADDTACRAGSGATASTAPDGAATQGSVTAGQYYACMASHGENVVQQQPQAYAYPAVAYPYAYPAIAAYPYPPYGYGYGYGYPFGAGYFGPYVGFGIGFRYGGFYGHGGYGGFYHGGYHR